MAAPALAAEQEEPLLARAGRSGLRPRSLGGGGAGCCSRCLEDAVAFTDAEVDVHQRLMDAAAVLFSKEDPVHETSVQRLWKRLLDGDYEPKSKRWRELGFQGDDPRTDFRGGGYLALRCLCYLVDHRLEDTKRWIWQSRTNGPGEYLFAASCVNVCALMLVHLDLNAQSVVPPAKRARKSCGLAIKRFLSPLPQREDGELQAFFELFAAGVEWLHVDWRTYCERNPGANLLNFGEALERLSAAIDYSLCAGAEPAITLQVIPGSAAPWGMSLTVWRLRLWSALLAHLLVVLRACCC